MIDMIVESNGNVSILDDNGDLHQLDNNSATPAAISKTWLPVLVRYLVSKIINHAPNEHLENDDADESESGSASLESRAVTPNEASPTGLKGGKVSKAGGRRRKAVRKR